MKNSFLVKTISTYQLNRTLLEFYSYARVTMHSNADVTNRFSVLSMAIISAWRFITVISSSTTSEITTSVIPVNKKITAIQFRSFSSTLYSYLIRLIIRVKAKAKNIIAKKIYKRTRGWNLHSVLYWIPIGFLHFWHEVRSVGLRCSVWRYCFMHC